MCALPAAPNLPANSVTKSYDIAKLENNVCWPFAVRPSIFTIQKFSSKIVLIYSVYLFCRFAIYAHIQIACCISMFISVNLIEKFRLLAFVVTVWLTFWQPSTGYPVISIRHLSHLPLTGQISGHAFLCYVHPSVAHDCTNYNFNVQFKILLLKVIRGHLKRRFWDIS